MSNLSSDATAPLSRRVLEARLRAATMDRSGAAGRVEMGGAWRSLRATPDLRGVPFRPYHVQLPPGHLVAVALMPTWARQPTKGHLGVEIVTPEGRIAAQAVTELVHQRSGQPAVFEFPAFATSALGQFELRVFVRQADAAVQVMEYAWPVPVPRRRRFGAVLLCGLGFSTPSAVSDRDERDRAGDGLAAPLVRIEHPPHREVDVTRGVLSVRGWAWSEPFGPGDVLVRVTLGDTPVLERRTTHRLCRPDLVAQWPAIPPTGAAGFEVSIDRSELPARSRAEIVFAAGGREWPVATLEVVASHDELGIGADTVVCEGCGADEARPMARKDGLAVVSCPRCHLAYTNPRPTWAQIAQRYSKEYFQAEYLPSIEGALDANRARWNYYLDQIERFKHVTPSLFEVGAGAGHLLREAAARGWSAKGIELNPWAVDHARRELQVDVQEGDVEAPDFELPGGGFGAVVLDSVLEHFRWPRQVIAKCARALRPGGGLLIWTMANDGDVLTREGAAFMYFGPSEHLFYFSATSLCRMCEDAGFRVEHLWRDETADSVVVLARRRLDVESGPA